MRIVALITVLMVSGCHLMGRSTGCDPVASADFQQGQTDCEESCRTCSPISWSCELVAKMTHGCLGHHPKYSRFHDNMLTRHDARKLACRELHANKCPGCVGCDYRKGYEQAFIDVSLGATGDVPALPPANFWTNCARTPGGHEKARDWFQGYADGAIAAKAIYEPYNKVAASQFYVADWPEVGPARQTPNAQWSSTPTPVSGTPEY